MSLKNPFTSRSIQSKDCSLQITIPKSDLDDVGASRNQHIPAQWSPEKEDWTLILDPYDTVDELRESHGEEKQALEIVDVGGSLGVTIPATLRRQHQLSDEDDLLLQPRQDGYYINISLVSGQPVASD